MFGVYIVLQFFIEEDDEFNKLYNKQTLADIAVSYLKGKFKWDIIPVIPFHLMFSGLPNNRNRLFYLIKLIRIK